MVTVKLVMEPSKTHTYNPNKTARNAGVSYNPVPKLSALIVVAYFVQDKYVFHMYFCLF